MKHFYDASDVMMILDCSRSTATRRISLMNAELKNDGYFIEQGKVPIEKFKEKYPYLKLEECK